LIPFFLSANGCVQSGGEKAKESAKVEWDLVWSDEFDYDGAPNPDKWDYDLGDACDKPAGCGWGNNEKQFYTKDPKNVIVTDGYLIINAIQEQKGRSTHTSTRLVSRGKAAWKYGRIEARLELPNGTGTWPAFWMLPEDWKYGGWPRSGEIDIMEHVGYNPEWLFGTVHTESFNHMKGTQVGDSIRVADMEQVPHLYAVEWFEDRIDFYVDDTKYHSFKKRSNNPDEWPFDQAFHVIIPISGRNV